MTGRATPRQREIPRVTHFNDCAGVGLRLVEAAARDGLRWRYVPPDQVRPPRGFEGASALARLPFVLRHWRVLETSDVIHVHYATAHHLLQRSYMPRRPYILHLHGSDVRIEWKSTTTRDAVQRAIDGAHTVFYANLDNRDEVLAARPDALYMPTPIDLRILPEWRPSEGKARRIVFASRWDESKGLETQLEVARKLRAAHGEGVHLSGLDWGPGRARAEDAGIRIVPRMPHRSYLDYLASADLVIGQASGLLGMSELEAMAIGPVVASPAAADHIEAAAPIIRGSIEEIVDASIEIISDPRAASSRLAARRWVESFHSADLRVPELQAVYANAAAS